MPDEAFPLPPGPITKLKVPTWKPGHHVACYLPLAGKVDDHDWAPVSTDYCRGLVSAFPAVPTRFELKKAKQWLIDHPRRRPTAGGIGPFLHTWMRNAQNDAARAALRGGGQRANDGGYRGQQLERQSAAAGGWTEHQPKQLVFGPGGVVPAGDAQGAAAAVPG